MQAGGRTGTLTHVAVRLAAGAGIRYTQSTICSQNLAESVAMSELNEARWSVLSERGCEASRLSYATAAQLIAQLRRDRIFGLCIITDEAAERLNHTPPATRPPAKKRTPKRKQAKL